MYNLNLLEKQMQLEDIINFFNKQLCLKYSAGKFNLDDIFTSYILNSEYKVRNSQNDPVQTLIEETKQKQKELEFEKRLTYPEVTLYVKFTNDIIVNYYFEHIKTSNILNICSFDNLLDLLNYQIQLNIFENQELYSVFNDVIINNIMEGVIKNYIPIDILIEKFIPIILHDSQKIGLLYKFFLGYKHNITKDNVLFFTSLYDKITDSILSNKSYEHNFYDSHICDLLNNNQLNQLCENTIIYASIITLYNNIPEILHLDLDNKRFYRVIERSTLTSLSYFNTNNLDEFSTEYINTIRENKLSYIKTLIKND